MYTEEVDLPTLPISECFHLTLYRTKFTLNKHIEFFFNKIKNKQTNKQNRDLILMKLKNILVRIFFLNNQNEDIKSKNI